MKAAKLFKIPAILLIFVLISYSNHVIAQVAECDDDNMFIKGSKWCPCPEDDSLSSICGLVSSADINEMDRDIVDRTVYTTRNAMKGVTVSIYENVEEVPTGQPFGNLEHKLVECETSETEGKYFCQMRRLNPGNLAYVVFSCNGKVADIKIVPTVRSITGLNSDVSCQGNLNYSPLPEVLTYAERDRFLGCESEPEKENENIGYEETEEIFHSPQIGEIDGDIRFTPFQILGIFGVHDGAFEERDCVLENLGAADLDEVCNLDPDRDDDGAIDGQDGNKLDDPNELTARFRNDIPTWDVELTHRVWETRTSVQREYQDPRAFQQFNHLTFGDCMDKAYLRYYGEENLKDPIPCSIIANCAVAVGDPRKNLHLTHSFGSMLASPLTWEEIHVSSQERDTDDIACRDIVGAYGPPGEDITVSEIQPPSGGVSCIPGRPGCPYKLPKSFYLPQFFVVAEGVKKPKTSETIGDAYITPPRNVDWLQQQTEAQNAEKSGYYFNKECTPPDKNNCGLTSLRIASDEVSEVGGIMVNRFVGFINAQEETYKSDYSMTVWDVGGNVKSLCSISNVTELTNNELIIPDDTTAVVTNTFRGDKDSHSEHEAASTATYATAEARARDEYLDMPQYTLSEVLDTLQRFASGDPMNPDGIGDLTLWLANLGGIFNAIVDSGQYKSFAERTTAWTADTPSYVNTYFCISEESFPVKFPAYGESNYPGEAPGCYPWNPLDQGEFCDVWPGRRESWDNIPASIRNDLGYTGGWPGIEGELRTCKLEECAIGARRRSCDEEICDYYLNPITNEYVAYNCRCGDGNGDGVVGSDISDPYIDRDCLPDEVQACLEDQEDTWRVDPGPPPQLSGPSYNDTFSYARWCNLEKAGPMVDPGDIGSLGPGGFSQNERVIQETWTRINEDGTLAQQSQFNAEPIADSANDAVARWLSPIESNTYYAKWAGNDYATTNDYGGIQGGQNGTVHERTAGATTKGDGFGGTVSMLEVISHPERPISLTEDFPELSCPSGATLNSEGNQCWFCDPFNPNDLDGDGDLGDWCYRIPPPGDVDLDNLNFGSCRPNLTGSCPLVGEVGGLALDIIGAAGNRVGTPGSLLLAAVVGEGGWLHNGSRILWDDTSIASYSDPWYARIPGCNDMIPAAQGPFGILDISFESAIAADGFHPSRVNADGVPIVSKCNFIDAAYAAAALLHTSNMSCSGLTETQAREALAVYRGGARANPDDVPDFLVDIALNCR